MWCWSEFKTRYQDSVMLSIWNTAAEQTPPLHYRRSCREQGEYAGVLTLLSGFCPWCQCSRSIHFYLVAIYPNAFAQHTSILHVHIFAEYTGWYVLVIQQLAIILSYNVNLTAAYQNALNNVKLRSRPLPRPQISERELLFLKVPRLLHALILTRAILTWRRMWSNCEM